jgi:hypothetical protein
MARTVDRTRTALTHAAGAKKNHAGTHARARGSRPVRESPRSISELPSRAEDDATAPPSSSSALPGMEQPGQRLGPDADVRRHVAARQARRQPGEVLVEPREPALRIEREQCMLASSSSASKRRSATPAPRVLQFDLDQAAGAAVNHSMSRRRISMEKSVRVGGEANRDQRDDDVLAEGRLHLVDDVRGRWPGVAADRVQQLRIFMFVVNPSSDHAHRRRSLRHEELGLAGTAGQDVRAMAIVIVPLRPQ